MIIPSIFEQCGTTSVQTRAQITSSINDTSFNDGVGAYASETGEWYALLTTNRTADGAGVLATQSGSATRKWVRLAIGLGIPRSQNWLKPYVPRR